MKIKNRALLAAGLVIGLTLPARVWAADFALHPSIAGEASFNDNLFLGTDSKLSTWRAVVYPGLALRYGSGPFKLQTTTSAAINRYIDNSEFNTEDQFYRVVSSYDFGRHNLNLNFRYTKIATLRTEIADTGDLRYTTQRERINLDPTWQYLLSENSRITLGYMYNENSYGKPTESASNQRPLTGSSSQGGNILLDYSVTNRLRVGTEFSYSHVTGETGYLADNYMLRFPASYDYSETFRTALNLGGRYINATTDTGDSGSGDLGFLLEFTFFKKFDIGRVNIAIAHDVQPSGFGTQRQRDSVKLDLTANVTETLFAGLLTQYFKNEDIGNSTSSFTNRDFFQVSPNLRWQWSHNLAMNAGYSFRAQKFDGQQGTAYGNLVFLTLGYSFDDLFLPE